jgi:hypothetical protein
MPPRPRPAPPPEPKPIIPDALVFKDDGTILLTIQRETHLLGSPTVGQYKKLLAAHDGEGGPAHPPEVPEIEGESSQEHLHRILEGRYEAQYRWMTLAFETLNGQTTLPPYEDTSRWLVSDIRLGVDFFRHWQQAPLAPGRPPAIPPQALSQALGEPT